MLQREQALLWEEEKTPSRPLPPSPPSPPPQQEQQREEQRQRQEQRQEQEREPQPEEQSLPPPSGSLLLAGNQPPLADAEESRKSQTEGAVVSLAGPDSNFNSNLGNFDSRGEGKSGATEPEEGDALNGVRVCLDSNKEEERGGGSKLEELSKVDSNCDSGFHSKEGRVTSENSELKEENLNSVSTGNGVCLKGAETVLTNLISNSKEAGVEGEEKELKGESLKDSEKNGTKKPPNGSVLLEKGTKEKDGREEGKEPERVAQEGDGSVTEDGEQSLTLEQIARLKIQKYALSRLIRGAPFPRLGPSRHEDDNSSVTLNKSVADQPSSTSKSVKGPLFRRLQEEMKKEAKKLSPSSLRLLHEKRLQQLRDYRVEELQDIPSFVPEDTRERAMIELKALKLLDIQKKVRYEIAMEKKLQDMCDETHHQLFDWGMLRLKRADVVHALSRWNFQLTAETDEQLRHRQAIERRKKEEEEFRLKETQAKARFVVELQSALRDLQLSSSTNIKRRKQRNDAVLAWHVKQRQRATKAEKMRVQALKAGDQEAYMKLVEESKNARLKTLLGKTDDLLKRLGAMVQRQKDLSHDDTPKEVKPKEKAKAVGEVDKKLRTKDGKFARDKDQLQDEIMEEDRDLMEGQRRYDMAVHAIEEKVIRQPASLKGGQLREYQIEGLQWMLSLYNNNLNGILADEMGLGKTIQTIAFLAYLQESKGLNGPHLILAPKAVLPNWAHEFATWMPSMIVVVYDGKKEERMALRERFGGDTKFNVMITHYDLIMRDKAFLKKIKWHYLVVDEGHRLKNHESMLARTLVTGYHIRRRLLLTGTPIQNSLSELWSLLNFLLPAIFNSSQNFEEWFNAPFADKVEVGLNEEEELLVIKRLHQVIRPFLLRRKKTEVEKHLPQKRQVILKCDLSAWQRIYYRQILDAGRVGLVQNTGRFRSLQNTAMQLRKCCNHPYLFLEGMDYEPPDRLEMIRCSGKFELLDRLLPKLKKSGHRVLLFSQMTRLMDILEDYFHFRGYCYLRLDGNTKTDERGRLLEAFNAENSPYFLFLLSTRAGGLGLNLQTADTVILFDSDWNPQMDQQAEDRAHRIGQKKEVRVFVLVSVGSIEEEILDRAKSKMGIDAKVIQAGLFNTTSTAQERREMLEMIMKRGTSALGSDVPGDRELNRSTARTEEEFRMFEKMDQERSEAEAASGKKRAPLMEEWEVPKWVFLDTQETKAAGEVVPESGIVEGKRKRAKVIYTDGLSEAQWLKVVEEGEALHEVMQASQDRIFNRKQKGSQKEEEEKSEQEKQAEEIREVMENEEIEQKISSHYESDPNEEGKTDDDAEENIRVQTLKRKRADFEESETTVLKENKWKFLHRATQIDQEDEDQEPEDDAKMKLRSSFGFGKRSKRR